MSETILEEAQRLVYGERQESYGHPADDFARTGRMWGAILGIPDIPPETVGLCMAAVKISRECNAHKRDNLTDLAGYAATVQLVAEHGSVVADFDEAVKRSIENMEILFKGLPRGGA